MKKKKKSVIPVAATILAIAAAVWFGGDGIYKQYMTTRHPRKYSDSIEMYSSVFDVDKCLIYAVAQTESGFRANAVSSAGARGVMQVTEETFDWIKTKIGEDDEIYDDMFDERSNIKYCTYYISYLYNKFGDMTCAISAYHAGAGSVMSWLELKKYSKDGVHLDKIPASDTEHYVNKVMSAYKIYKKLYG